MASEGLCFRSLSLIPSPGCEEVQQHLLAPEGEGGAGSVSQGMKHSCRALYHPVLLQLCALPQGGQRHSTCCTGQWMDTLRKLCLPTP